MGIEHQPVKYTAGSNQLTRWAVWMLIYFKSQCFHVDVEVLKGLKPPSIIQYRVFFSHTKATKCHQTVGDPTT